MKTSRKIVAILSLLIGLSCIGFIVYRTGFYLTVKDKAMEIIGRSNGETVIEDQEPEDPESSQTSADPQKKTSMPSLPSLPTKIGPIKLVTKSFDEEYHDFMKNKSKGENFTISPLSLKTALCLAIVGADGNTKKDLLSAAGFGSEEEMYEWNDSVFQMKEDFYNIPNGDDPKKELIIANAIWKNADEKGGFSNAYIELVADKFHATAETAPGDSLVQKINDWCNKNTKGMIPSIVDDLTETSAVLTNAIYFCSQWEAKISKKDTDKKLFYITDENYVMTDFMKTQISGEYYVDNKTELVAIPMKGNVYTMYVLGDDTDIPEKFKKAYEYSNENRLEITAYVPLIESETTIDNITDFIVERGGGIAFGTKKEDPDFSVMNDDKEHPWQIKDIIQKTKFEANEEGVKAAVVTPVYMDELGALPEPKKQEITFIADKPFSYYVLYNKNGEEPVILFSGRYEKP